MINTVAIIQIMPKIPMRVNSFPRSAHPNKAADIGSKDESYRTLYGPNELYPFHIGIKGYHCTKYNDGK